MALPTDTDLKTMDYSFAAQPFVSVPAKSTIDLTTMDYSFAAQPFVANPVATGGYSGAIKTVNGLARASVKTFNGLAIASIKTINGLA